MGIDTQTECAKRTYSLLPHSPLGEHIYVWVLKTCSIDCSIIGSYMVVRNITTNIVTGQQVIEGFFCSVYFFARFSTTNPTPLTPPGELPIAVPIVSYVLLVRCYASNFQLGSIGFCSSGRVTQVFALGPSVKMTVPYLARDNPHIAE
jgi:hypothetical protein